jgi:hypothetical protein
MTEDSIKTEVRDRRSEIGGRERADDRRRERQMTDDGGRRTEKPEDGDSKGKVRNEIIHGLQD